MLKWYDIRVPGVGSICIKAEYAAQALVEAEDRMGATAEQMKKASCVMVGAYMTPHPAAALPPSPRGEGNPPSRETVEKAAPRSEPSEGGKGDNV